MNTTTKRRFVSGYPWWFSTAFIGFGIFFAILIIALRPASFPWAPLLTVIAIIIGSFVYRLGSPQIYLGGDCLYVSRWWRKATIPIDHIAGIDEAKPSWPFRSYSAVIHFTTDTPFGRSLYLGSFGSVPSMTFPWALKDLKRAIEEVATKRPNQTMQPTAGRSEAYLSHD